MVINVPSVMHTGTRLLTIEILKGTRGGKYNLDDYKYTNIPPMCGDTDDGDDHLHVGHVFSENMDLWREAMRKFPTIVPLRHPSRVLESYRRRGKSEDVYKSQWDNLISLVKDFKVLYLHADMPNIRDDELKNISELAGWNVSSDFPATKKTGSEYGTHDLTISDELLSDTPKEYIDFYMETVNAG